MTCPSDVILFPGLEYHPKPCTGSLECVVHCCIIRTACCTPFQEAQMLLPCWYMAVS